MILTISIGLEIASLRSNLSHEQITPVGRRLCHYSLEEFFYPRLAVVFLPTPRPNTSPHAYPSLWRSLQIAALVLPTAAALSLFANQSALVTELSQAKLALAQCSASVAEGCPVIVETVIVTATETIYTASSQSHSRWWHSSSDSSTSTSLAPSVFISTSTSSTSTTSSVPSSSSSVRYVSLTTTVPTVTPTRSIPTTTSNPPPPLVSQSQSHSNALILPNITFPWFVKLDILQLEIPEQARVTLSYAVRGFGFAWQLVRKVIHYPLDPP